MYLRRYGKKVNGEEYAYWSLVESFRTARGPRQRVVASIGKLPGLDKEERVGWEEILRILSGKPQPQESLFKKTEEAPSWATVDINRVSVERLRGLISQPARRLQTRSQSLIHQVLCSHGKSGGHGDGRDGTGRNPLFIRSYVLTN